MFLIFFRGLIMGSSVYNISLLLDKTVCKKSYLKLLEENKFLYKEGITKCFNNLVLIAPLFYISNNYFLINKSINNIEFLNIILLTLGHNVFYYFAHIMMHKINCIRFIHEFHHRFEKNMVPSIGNAVSESEFLFAYLFPFISMTYILNPTQISLDISISIIAVLNMFIHTDLLYNLPYNYYLVSPKDHIDHHNIQYKHYAAPLINIDNLLNNKN
jgi:sterol desaturase/sphingolipid hydroxylase (fatty acid hydroxylase superfamily)